MIRKLLLSAAAAALVFTGVGRLPAQDIKPLALISLASYDTITADVNAVAQITEMPELPAGLQGLIGAVTHGQGLKGLDTTKPIGVIIYLQGTDPKALAFIPVTDLKALVAAISPAAPQENNGVLEFQGPAGMIYAVEHNGWAFLSNEAASLSSAPADPVKLLGGLDKAYVVAARIHVQNLPDAQKQMFIDAFKQGMANGMQQQQADNQAMQDFQKKYMDGMAKNVEQYAKETDQFTIGWAIDANAKSTHLDFTFTALAGSDLAKKFAGISKGHSDFAGFSLPTAAATLGFNCQLDADGIEQAVAMVNVFRAGANGELEKNPALKRSEQVRKWVTDVINGMTDVMEKTAKTGRFDGGLMVVAEPNSLAVAGGGFVKDGEALNAVVKKFVDLAAADPGFPEFKFDADSYKGVKIHSMSIPVKDDPVAQKVFGDKMDAYLGIGTQSAYVAFGKGSLDLLKAAIDRSQSSAGQPAAPFELKLSLTPLLQLANSIEENPATGAMLQMLAASAGKDHVRISATPIPNGANYRIQVEEGVLKLAGFAAKMATMRGAPGGAGFGPQPGAGDDNPVFTERKDK